MIEEYIVDFCAMKKKLVIELDGSGHTEEDKEISDKERDQRLEELGYKVLRIYNNEIDTNFEGVCEEINSQIKERGMA